MLFRSHQITVIGPNDFTYTVVGTPPTPANGSNILASNGKTSLGWRLLYEGTNKAAFQPRVGSGMILQVIHDTQPYAALARGYETMSDVDTGTGPYPTVAQVSTGITIQGTNNTAGPKDWIIIGDEYQMCYIINPTGGQQKTFFFGDLLSLVPSDPYNSVIIGPTNGLTKIGRAHV